MSQIAVPPNEDITALVTYHFPKPFSIEYEYLPGKGRKYWTIVEGQKITFDSEDHVLAWLEDARHQIPTIPATISNIHFLRTRYVAEALKIYGNDLKVIQRELDKIPRRTYETAQEMLNDCTPIYYEF